MDGDLAWFELDSDRLQREFAALRDVGADVVVDAEAKEAGVLRFVVDYRSRDLPSPHDKGGLRLVVVFPDSYPIFRPEVFAEELSLPRHQNPRGKNLCLLPRPTQYWNPEWTVAEYLRLQLPEAITKGSITDPEVIGEDENEQAEPITDFYDYASNATVLLNDPFVGLSALDEDLPDQGRLKLRARELKPLAFPLLISEIYDDEDNVLASVPSSIKEEYLHQLDGAWYRAEMTPPVDSPKSIYDWLKDQTGVSTRLLKDASAKDAGNGSSICGVIGIVFPEEDSPGHKDGWGWLFLIEVQQMVQLSKGGRERPVRVPRRDFYLARAGRIDLESFQSRIPLLAPLRDKTVSLVGLGALGAPAALEFARAGIANLRVLDFDKVAPETTVRWPLGLTAAGVDKTKAVQEFIESNYPHTTVSPIDHRLGNLRAQCRGTASTESPEWKILDRLFDGSDLIVDCAAEEGVSHLLSREAKERDVPYIQVYATRGSWGGLVMRQLPSEAGGCWMCLQHSIFEGKIAPPPEDLSGGIQPRGCADPTFTGASFDLLNVSLAGVRLGVATLCRENPGMYPDLDWDVGVLSLVDTEGNPVPPTWCVARLKHNSECPYCPEQESLEDPSSGYANP